MTLDDILADLYGRLGYRAAPDAKVVSELTRHVNTTHRQLLTLPGVEFLRDDTITFASAASQARYGLPQAVAKLNGIHDRTNDRPLIPTTLAWIRQRDPGLDASGVSTHYAPVGWMAVSKQPSDASELYLDSTSASDVQHAYIEGIRTGGYPISLEQALTGTTALSLSATYTDILEVTKFYLDHPAVGSVTLLEDSGAGTELARIAPGQSSARYFAVQLYPTPSGTVTYYADYQRQISQMRVGQDEPLLPVDFHDLLVLGAERIARRDKDDDRTREVRAEYSGRISQFRYWLHSSEAIPVMGGRQQGGISRLGGQYPADTRA